MDFLVEKAREYSPTGVFAYSDVLIWLGGTRNSVRCKILRSVDAGDVLSIRRGLYCLAKRHLSNGISRNLLANLIYGPSYISMETALAFHGWIPEAVHSVTSVSLGRARTFDTPLGFFDYVQVRQSPLLAGVERIEGAKPEYGSFYMANPPRGADYCGKTCLFPFPTGIRCFDRASSFAGELHALLCRTYIKGRDWFDLIGTRASGRRRIVRSFPPHLTSRGPGQDGMSLWTGTGSVASSCPSSTEWTGMPREKMFVVLSTLRTVRRLTYGPGISSRRSSTA